MTTASDIDLVVLEPTSLPVRREMPQWRLMAGDFYDLTKPRLNFLVLVTTVVGFHLAANGRGEWAYLPATLVGTALTAAGASVLNQLIERQYDALMPRTRNRPLAARRLGAAEALGFGVGLSIGGILLLALLVNLLTAALAAFTLLSYVLIYTPMKRWTTLNTVVGAIPGAIPPVIGWTAARGDLSLAAASLFAILFIWQMPHFLAIATLYRRDYELGGFKMLPVIDVDLTVTGRQMVAYAAALIPASLLPLLLGMVGWFYAPFALIGGAVFLALTIQCARTRQRADARRVFFASIIYLPVILAAMWICAR